MKFYQNYLQKIVKEKRDKKNVHLLPKIWHDMVQSKFCGVPTKQKSEFMLAFTKVIHLYGANVDPAMERPMSALSISLLTI